MPQETEEQLENKIRLDCWNQSKQCFGYSFMYGKKAKVKGRMLNASNVLGILIPFILGTAALGGMQASYFQPLVIIGGILLSVQAIFSAYTLISKWDTKLSYYIESKIDRGNLSDEFKDLANFSATTYSELKSKYDLLKEKLKARSNQDAHYDLKDWERRYGMKSALREFQRECAGCKIKPTGLSGKNDCEVCGKYNRILIFNLFKL